MGNLPEEMNTALSTPALEHISVRSAATSAQNHLAYIRGKLRNILIEQGKARAHASFLQHHICNGTIPRGLAIDKLCAALRKDITTIQEKWTEVLTDIQITLEDLK